MESALRSIPDELDPVRAVERLKRALGTELGRRAAELRELRIRARARHGLDRLPFLTPKGLEQASAGAVADHRALELMARLGPSRIWDATCGIGSDAAAVRAAGLGLVASDTDAAILAFARENLARCAPEAGPGALFVADATRPALRRDAADAVLLDPDRRPRGRRVRAPEAWSPPLSACLGVARTFPAACLKLAPGMDPAPLAGLGRPCWISLRGELRELSLWTGRLAGDEPGPEAVALDGRGGVARLAGPPVEVAPLDPAAAAAVRWLAEPDPAVIRAGLVGRLAAEEALAPIGPRLAYLGGERRPASPLLRAWRVLGTAPLDRRRVRALLRAHDVGPLTVKKRGHPDPADVLARRLAGPGRRPGLLAVARLERGHLALLLEGAGDAAES